MGSMEALINVLYLWPWIGNCELNGTTHSHEMQRHVWAPKKEIGWVRIRTSAVNTDPKSWASSASTKVPPIVCSFSFTKEIQHWDTAADSELGECKHRGGIQNQRWYRQGWKQEKKKKKQGARFCLQNRDTCPFHQKPHSLSSVQPLHSSCFPKVIS